MFTTMLIPTAVVLYLSALILSLEYSSTTNILRASHVCAVLGLLSHFLSFYQNCHICGKWSKCNLFFHWDQMYVLLPLTVSWLIQLDWSIWLDIPLESMVDCLPWSLPLYHKWLPCLLICEIVWKCLALKQPYNSFICLLVPLTKLILLSVGWLLSIHQPLQCISYILLLSIHVLLLPLLESWDWLMQWIGNLLDVWGWWM